LGKLRVLDPEGFKYERFKIRENLSLESLEPRKFKNPEGSKSGRFKTRKF